MDSLTQAVLGATVGSATRGPTLGRRAALWGAVAGTLPDLDVLTYPFLDPAGQLHIHRGVTHGLAFAFVAGPLLGWLVWRFERWRGRDGGWRDWALVMFWGLLTHPLLDVFTIYGTQLLAPFSDHPFAVGSVFILDPFVTLALVLGLAVALRAGRARRARGAALAGLAVGVAYLGVGVGLQAHARETVQAAMAQRGLAADRLTLGAGPLSSLIWRGVARDGDALHPFSLHVSDAPREVLWQPPVRAARLPPEYAASRAGRTLLWFSRGWLAEVPGDGLAVADVRFGRLGLDADDPWVFTWDLTSEPPFTFRQRREVSGLERGEAARLFRRILGAREDPGPPPAVPSRRPSPDIPSP